MIAPYNQTQDKKSQVRQMFDGIAAHYDLLNHTLSFGIDRIWRRNAIRRFKADKPSHILDVATGTGDFAILAHRKLGCRVTGVDLSPEMLKVGIQKVEKAGFAGAIKLEEGDSENLPYENGAFDGVMAAFGVRNFGNLNAGLSEMARVTKKGGRVVILEFSKPKSFPFKQIYMFYFKHILPAMGGAVSQDKQAYEYLPASVLAFPDGTDFEEQMIAVGITPVSTKQQTFGVATIYEGIKN